MARLTTAECEKLVQSDVLRKVPERRALPVHQGQRPRLLERAIPQRRVLVIKGLRLVPRRDAQSGPGGLRDLEGGAPINGF